MFESPLDECRERLERFSTELLEMVGLGRGA